MNSEKMKEIKGKLKGRYYYLDQAYSDHLTYGGKADEQQEAEIFFLGDILTLINELESDNKELKKYKTDWLNSEKMHLQADMEDTEFELASSNRLFKIVSKENQQLKDRITELEKEIKENPSYAKGYADGIKNTYEAILPQKLENFAEMLKGQMNEGEYMGKKYKLSVFRDIDIDEILKEFMKKKFNNEVK